MWLPARCYKPSRLPCPRARWSKADTGHLTAIKRLFLMFNEAGGDCWNSEWVSYNTLQFVWERDVIVNWPVIFQLFWSRVTGTKAEQRGLHLSIQSGLLQWVFRWIALWLCGDVVRHKKALRVSAGEAQWQSDFRCTGMYCMREQRVRYSAEVTGAKGRGLEMWKYCKNRTAWLLYVFFRETAHVCLYGSR